MRRLAAALLVMCTVMVGCGTPGSQGVAKPAEASTGRACEWRSTPPRTWDHVVWVVLENHSYHQLIGTKGSTARHRSPYLNHLARSCGRATNYWGITHPSLPNYLAMVSGSRRGVRTDCLPAACPQHRRTIFDQVRSWKVYAESMPSACLRTNSGRYVARHNPPTYFSSLSSSCASRDLPMGSLAAGNLARDLASGSLPRFALVVPNQCHNTHDCAIARGDAWLAKVVPAIVRSATYRQGRTAIFVTYDEGAGGSHGQHCRTHRDESCHVVTVVVSPTTDRLTKARKRFDHYSLLETTERMLGLPLLRHAGARSTKSMRKAFDL